METILRILRVALLISLTVRSFFINQRRFLSFGTRQMEDGFGVAHYLKRREVLYTREAQALGLFSFI